MTVRDPGRTAMQIEELIARLESATEGSRELDIAIHTLSNARP